MRERLIELLSNLDVYNCEECQNCPSFKYNLECDDNCFTAKVADYMLAMGVTVVVRGRWIDNCCYNTCSACGNSIHAWNDDGDLQEFSYCPNCEVNMKDGE